VGQGSAPDSRLVGGSGARILAGPKTMRGRQGQASGVGRSQIGIIQVASAQAVRGFLCRIRRPRSLIQWRYESPRPRSADTKVCGRGHAPKLRSRKGALATGSRRCITKIDAAIIANPTLCVLTCRPGAIRIAPRPKLRASAVLGATL